MAGACPPEGQDWLGVRVCKVFPLDHAWLVVSQGSVVDFEGDAIVNAANKGCIGGGGVDRAITTAGGKAMETARWQLPVVPGSRSTRCPTGEARMTIGGDLKARFCIHAVGPDYPVLMQRRGRKALAECDALVTSAYRASLNCASQEALSSVAFSLISAGIFRGVQTLENVLVASLAGIQEGLYAELREVHLVAFKRTELAGLLSVCSRTLSPPGVAAAAVSAAAVCSVAATAVGPPPPGGAAAIRATVAEEESEDSAEDDQHEEDSEEERQGTP